MNKNWPGWRSKTIRRKLLSALSDEEIAALSSHWGFWARPDQLPPAGNWTSWMMLGGRGAGKTRTGAEWVRARVERKKHPARFIALIGETYAAARAVMVEGPSGYFALYEDTAWHFFAPQSGWRLWDEAAGELMVFDGAVWQSLKATGAGQQSGLVQQVTTEAAITDNQLAEIPSHVIFLGLTALVIEEIKGT